ncbi:acyltransferase [Chitinimonas prasina]|uniref:Acyltransferase n=1 Tax=Chitinimonas prasina TaxID=1434937 RepID=A0ABQ5YJR0_9NEIS|nr:acyltransferase [Chitinimonas prasina]GLR15231.1 acyltransferase [Chitinimonas prasina]
MHTTLPSNLSVTPLLSGQQVQCGVQAAQQLHTLQCLRGLAALMVLVFHCALLLAPFAGAPLLGGLLAIGSLGVELFFVLSGFIIMWMHGDDIGRPYRAGVYLLKRLLRIYPPYWVVLLLTLAASWYLGTRWEWLRPLMDIVILHPATPEPMLVGIGWTLRFELAFYLVFGVLILNRSLGLFLMASWLLGIMLLAGKLVSIPWSVAYLFSNYSLLFFFGMASALWARYGATSPVGRWLVEYSAPLAATLCFWLAVAFLQSGKPIAEDGLGISVLGLALAVLMQASLSPYWEARSRKLVWLEKLGDASYSIYLTHMGLLLLAGLPAFRWLLGLGLPQQQGPWLLVLLLACLLCVGCGLLFHHWLERPLLRWGRRRLGG